MNNYGFERNPVLLWTSCLLMVAVVSFLILPKIVQSGISISGVETCATHTVQPVSCSTINGDDKEPWKVNVQMTEPVDPNLEGQLIALRASAGNAYADLKYNQSGFPVTRGKIIQVQILGNTKGSVPLNTQVVVDSVYALPSGDTTLCHSLPLTCL